MIAKYKLPPPEKVTPYYTDHSSLGEFLVLKSEDKNLTF